MPYSVVSRQTGSTPFPAAQKASRTDFPRLLRDCNEPLTGKEVKEAFVWADFDGDGGIAPLGTTSLESSFAQQISGH